MQTTKREPRQQRAKEKKEKIIEAGFKLICENGYHNTNTADIAKKAGVSTGIVYQYFTDKYDIFMNALKKYGDDIFFPMLKLKNKDFTINNLESTLKTMITNYIEDHKISQIAHEEIMAMVHSDKLVAEYYYQKELEMTTTIKELLIKSNLNSPNLTEKVHIMIGLIDNLCHEIIYHKHQTMNYEAMTSLVITTINSLLNQQKK